MLLEVLENFVMPVATICLSVVLGYAASKRRADKEFRLRKLEELWVKVDMHGNEFSGLMMDTVRLMNTGDPEQARQHATEEANRSYSELSMLIEIYFPSLKSSLHQMEDVKLEFIHAVGRWSRGERTEKAVSHEILLLSEKLSQRRYSLRAETGALAKEINESGPLARSKRWLESWAEY